MNKREHFERWLKSVKPELPMYYDAEEDFYYHPIADTAYRAWLASPKTRPTEPSKITKEQLAAMRADTSGIVDNLRGIYAGAASRYPVTPLMMKAADEIERLREEVKGYEMRPSGMQVDKDENGNVILHFS
jgi:hypothetical protein